MKIKSLIRLTTCIPIVGAAMFSRCDESQLLATSNLWVTASFGYDKSLVSYLYVSYGTESEPQVSCALSVQNVHFVNEGGRPERVYPVSARVPILLRISAAQLYFGFSGDRSVGGCSQ